MKKSYVVFIITSKSFINFLSRAALTNSFYRTSELFKFSCIQ